MNTSLLLASLNEYKPQIAQSYKNIITSQFNRMISQIGPELKNVVNDWTWAKIWREVLSKNSKRINISDNPLKPLYNYEINNELLDRNASNYAEDVIQQWKFKIESKIGDLDTSSVFQMDAGSFIILGKKNNNDVKIIQTTIINFSKNGKVFNQFPARIYLNGKAISEVAYKRFLKDA